MSVLKKKRVCIVVLGDIGRSPRMQYHAKSLLSEGFDVDIICYSDTEPIEEIKNYANFKVLSKTPELNFSRTLNYIFKTLWQTLALLIALLSIQKPKYLLCQNPPAIPTLSVCYIYCLLMRVKFIIDWHNYAHTIMGLTHSPQSMLVKFAKSIEILFGQKSHANFCVTKAMKENLIQQYRISATVLYDRPPQAFKPISVEDKHKFYRKLCQDYIAFNTKLIYPDEIPSHILEETIITQKLENGNIEYKTNRPGILVSSTSWTPDEDFSILLSALDEYEKAVEIDRKHYPNLICIITGKGPLKQFYLEIISRRKWKYIEIITPWLAADDYPLMLAASDLGVCLHYSSSGLDLPMKIVDMFGSGLPVCAMKFNCLNELVNHGENGFIFEDSYELAEQIKTWFYSFPNSVALFDTKRIFQENLNKFQTNRWQENWKKIAKPMFE